MGGLMYPEAEFEAQKCKDFIDVVNDTRESIDNAVNTRKGGFLTQGYFLDPARILDGEYYNIYSEKAAMWVREALRIQEVFIGFQKIRDSYYKIALEEYITWSGRINLRYPD